jgi:NAD(P)-dependent dehydrogenase (short-subunit alcohol dehydrogenase family)
MTTKVAVITGASRGIGRNTALFFAKKGYTVIGTGRNKSSMCEVQEELDRYDGDHQMMSMDVSKPEEINNVIHKVKKDYGKIDVWVNNAGAFKALGPTWEVAAEDWLNDVSTNLFGIFHCIQAIVPVMLRQEFGSIINIAGGGTVGTFKYGNGYGTSKTAVARFTENLAAELEGTPIKAFVLDPGLNDTDMTRYQRDTEVGQRYFSFIEDLFQQNHDVPPEQAPQWVYHLASGELDEYVGRLVSVYDDLQALKENTAKLTDADHLTLRLKK